MKLVEIPIRRFQPDAPLTRDTFLFLPLNNKSIRIGISGEAISESLLARILAKGHTHLRVSEEAQIDPETFPVHVSNAPPVAEPSAPAGAGVEDTKESIPVAAPAFTTEPVSAILVATEAPATEPESRFSASPEQAEPIQTFSAEDGTAESSVLAGQGAEDIVQTRLKATAETEGEDEENRFGADPKEEEESQTIGGEEEKEQYVRKFASEKEKLPAIIRLHQKMAEKKEGNFTFDLKAEKESALAEAKSIILSSKISEKIISLSEQSLNAEPSLRDSLRGQIRGLKTTLEQIDAGDLQSEAQAEPETKEEIASIAETLASASRAEHMHEVTERLAAHALTRELAMSALNEPEEGRDNKLARSATSRDLPGTVSRLAAYLGHSLGYTNVDFLADLACGAIAHFAKKEGDGLNEEMLPPFSRRIISTDESIADETISDSREILQFLEAYLADEECDRSHKDLMKRIFDRTMEGFSERIDGPSSWTLNRWSAFVNRGPTMDSHSICTRASAKAVKFARSATP